MDRYVLRVTASGRILALQAYGGRNCRCTQQRDVGGSKHSRSLGQATASRDEIVDEHSRTGRKRPSYPEGPGKVLAAGCRAQPGLIGDPTCLGQC